MRDKYGDERRTQITIDPGDLDVLDLIEDEELVVVLSQQGLREDGRGRRVPTQGRGGRGVRGGNLRDEDYVEHLLTTTAHSYLLFFSNRGASYRLRAHEIPMKERTARGTALVNLHLARSPTSTSRPSSTPAPTKTASYLFFATKNGMVKKTQACGVRLVAAQRPDRDQPQRGRRAGAGRPDHRRGRHLHGVAATA